MSLFLEKQGVTLQKSIFVSSDQYKYDKIQLDKKCGKQSTIW